MRGSAGTTSCHRRSRCHDPRRHGHQCPARRHLLRCRWQQRLALAALGRERRHRRAHLQRQRQRHRLRHRVKHRFKPLRFKPLLPPTSCKSADRLPGSVEAKTCRCCDIEAGSARWAAYTVAAVVRPLGYGGALDNLGTYLFQFDNLTTSRKLWCSVRFGSLEINDTCGASEHPKPCYDVIWNPSQPRHPVIFIYSCS